MSGRPLDAVRRVPANLWQHRGAELVIEVPDLAARPLRRPCRRLSGQARGGDAGGGRCPEPLG
jgi:hypothetical protein